jgi:hypothetical protein
MHFGTAFRIIDSNLTHLLVLSIYYYTSPFDNPSSSFSFDFKSSPLRTSNLVSVDLLDVLDRLALQVLGVDLLRRGIGLDDGLGLGLWGYDDMSKLDAF